MADWPVPWRHNWGGRANALRAEGRGWREAEPVAFEEARAERTRGWVSRPPPALDPAVLAWNSGRGAGPNVLGRRPYPPFDFLTSTA